MEAAMGLVVAFWRHHLCSCMLVEVEGQRERKRERERIVYICTENRDASNVQRVHRQQIRAACIVYTGLCICAYIYIYRRTYTHTYIHTYTHTYKHIYCMGPV